MEIVTAIMVTAMVSVALLIPIEGLLKSIWNRPYFTNGILIYRKKLFLHHNVDISNAISYVEKMVKPNFFHGSIQLQQIENNTFAFRYKPFEFRVFAMEGDLMRRIILYNPKDGEMEVRGYINWFYLPLIFIFCFGPTAMAIANTIATNDMPSFSDVVVSLLCFVGFAFFFFIMTIYSRYAIDAKVNDQVIYYIKVFFRNQITES